MGKLQDDALRLAGTVRDRLGLLPLDLVARMQELGLSSAAIHSARSSDSIPTFENDREAADMLMALGFSEDTAAEMLAP